MSERLTWNNRRGYGERCQQNGEEELHVGGMIAGSTFIEVS